jgi:hypothetical protein
MCVCVTIFSYAIKWAILNLFSYRSNDTTGNTKGRKYHCTNDLQFDWFGISCITTDNFCFYLQNRLIQTSQTGGQWYSETSPFSIPWIQHHLLLKSSTGLLSLVNVRNLNSDSIFYEIFLVLNFRQSLVS